MPTLPTPGPVGSAVAASSAVLPCLVLPGCLDANVFWNGLLITGTSTVVEVPVAEFLRVLSASSRSIEASSSLSLRPKGSGAFRVGSTADASIREGSGGGDPSCVSSPTRPIVDSSSSSCTLSGDKGGGVCMRTRLTLDDLRSVSGAMEAGQQWL